VNIGELSARSGVSARSIRYYEQVGLIEAGRAGNGYRYYDERAVDAVRTIRSMFDLGFARDDVRAVLGCASGDAQPLDHEVARDAMRGVRDDIAGRIDELTRTRRALDRFLDRTAPRP